MMTVGVAFAATASAADPVCKLAVGPYASGSSQAQCPAFYQAVGGGFMSTGAPAAYYLVSPPSSPTGYSALGAFVQTDAACCNFFPGVVSANGTTSATATCTAGTIAVGGGGFCTGGALLTESEPVQRIGGAGGSRGGIPGGWRAACSGGTAMVAYANCVATNPVGGPDLSSCQIVWVSAPASPAAAICPAGKMVVAAGTRCATSYPTFAWIQPTPDQTYSECADAGALVAYAICCNGTRVP